MLKSKAKITKLPDTQTFGTNTPLSGLSDEEGSYDSIGAIDDC